MKRAGDALTNLRKNIESLTRPTSILIIEDNEQDADLLRHAIKSVVPSHIRCILTAEYGLMLIRRNHYDVIFLDLNLPKISGVEFIRQLTRDEIRRLVVITGLGSESQDTLEAIRLGVVKIIQKPASLTDLKTIFGHE